MFPSLSLGRDFNKLIVSPVHIQGIRNTGRSKPRDSAQRNPESPLTIGIWNPCCIDKES